MCRWRSVAALQRRVRQTRWPMWGRCSTVSWRASRAHDRHQHKDCKTFFQLRPCPLDSELLDTAGHHDYICTKASCRKKQWLFCVEQSHQSCPTFSAGGESARTIIVLRTLLSTSVSCSQAPRQHNPHSCAHFCNRAHDRGKTATTTVDHHNKRHTPPQ
jgi:hypothetical protein